MTTAYPGPDTRATGAASTLGLGLAGLGLIGSILPWTGQPPVVPVPGVEGSVLAAALALTATVVFSLRRHGALDRRVGAPVAGGLSLCLSVYAIGRLTLAGIDNPDAPVVGIGLPITAVAGLCASIVAIADWNGIADRAVWAKLRALGTGLGIGLAAFASSAVASLPMLALGAIDTTWEYTLFVVLSYGGMIGFVFLYLHVRDLGLSYLDIEVPTRRDLAVMIGGFLSLLVLLGVITTLLQRLGIPSASPGVMDEVAVNPEIALALVALSVLVIGPAEELAYRNVLQKYLYEWFSGRSAVFFGTALFAVVHLPQYWVAANPLATLNALALVFVLSLLLGYVYYRTENVLVPMVIHGLFNGVQFAAFYVQLTNPVPTV